MALAWVVVAEVVAVATVVVGTATREPTTVARPRPVSTASVSPWLTRLAEEAARTPGPLRREPPRRFTVAATGDLLIHLPVTRQAAAYAQGTGGDYDFTPMFRQVAPVLQAADLAVCHLEVPLSADARQLSGFPRFAAPRQLAGALADVGFDACSTASNHVADQGAAGLTTTLDALDAAGVAHAGTAPTRTEARRPRLHQVNGVTVAHLSYTYGLNGLPLPEPWMVNRLDPAAVAADAAAARDTGADAVIASLHWGVQYRRAPTATQRDLARRLLGDADVDLILGHHAHVLQPAARLNERVVLYGLGDFLSNQATPVSTQEGAVAVVTFEETAGGEFEATGLAYVPTRVDRRSHTIVDVDAALDRDELPAARRRRLTRSWQRIREAITAEGIDNWGANVYSAPELADRLQQ